MSMKKAKRTFLSALLTLALAFAAAAGFTAQPVKAAAGTVYTCTINRCYAHPVTGVIEDSGGESSYATGQGMVEGAVYGTGMLEVTDSGEYYLTIRMSLMDYTSNHSFWVQSVGDSGWSTPAMGQTGSGSDSNGTTADITIQVPSENCVVRGGMYVEPMGRDVIFYLYPSNFSAGNSTDMMPAMVTEASGSGSSNETYETNESAGTAQSGDSNLSNGGTLESGAESLESAEEETTETSGTSEEEKTALKLENSITEAATPEISLDTESSTLDSAKGLSLSTADEAQAEETDADSTAASGSPVMSAVLFLVVGLILIAVVAVLVFVFRKNWKRWGGAQDDDEE